MKAGWRKRKLSEVLEVQNGYAFNSRQFVTGGGMPLVRIRDLRGGWSTETNFDGDFDERYRVRAGDFLIGMDGEFGCFEWRGPDALLNQRVCKLTNFAADVDARFLFYGINSHLKAIEDATTYTTVKHLSSKQIHAIEFLFPPLEEQRRIVAVLDEAFAAIATATANAEKNLANARELFSASLANVLDGQRKGWLLTSLRSLGKTLTGNTPKTSVAANFGDHIPFIKPGDFRPNGSLDYGNEALSVQGASASRLIPADAALMVCIGATIGKSGFTETEVTANQQVNAFIPRAGLSGKFAFYQFLTARFQRAVLSGSGQATLPIINKSKWSDLEIYVPDDTREQQAVVDLLDATMLECEALEATIRKKMIALDALKQSLLHRAFTGELTAAMPETIAA
ncbi:restriction endonuclease subunit S [Novosphingobium album (ex Liu et al. 2023)]|uniref:Restriction endonuclease subunit S n=1 Tax=Novosphingobium album (ex Liu et al. 2023) TaxID=3031130 RepID=A0ABT5WV47_9SPHN|nr:restriction endonuclease subunit S [Novosphingobium album (ex Liu et al. 2023)]MDE8653729.1 restriction endonuclease subunit S [Novosphingobium album (ex Liu et al. 2023)]